MRTVKQAIEEDDVVALSVPVGKWPAWTTGTAVSIYDDAALVEIAEDEPPGRALDMIDVPFSQLELVWSGRTGWVDGWKPDGSPATSIRPPYDLQIPSRSCSHGRNRLRIIS
jgi:hypothetical protein